MGKDSNGKSLVPASIKEKTVDMKLASESKGKKGPIVSMILIFGN
ncbi:MAG: hypothetical protein ACLUI5_05850 [Fusicatenibacter saccharivorans]